MYIDLCRHYVAQRVGWDYYATTIGTSLVVILGVLGNACTLFTLSGHRLTTATFVYYRAVAWVDLCRCIVVFTYILRVLIPFRHYYWTTWYEAHIMYFMINTLGFVSTTLAVLLCFRLCYSIVQSKRLKKMHSSAKYTKRLIYGVTAFSVLINVWLCVERDVTSVVADQCLDHQSENESQFVMNSSRMEIYSLHPSEFSSTHPNLYKAVHGIPTVILLILFGGTLGLLLLCVVAFSDSEQRGILSNTHTSSSNSKTWRTQRQLCKLFLILSVSYACGLLPRLIYQFFFTNTPPMDSSEENSTNTTEEYARELYKRSWQNYMTYMMQQHVAAAILNVFQNFAHAISFYVYMCCSEQFRNEFLCKIRRVLGHPVHRAYTYSSVRLSRISVRFHQRSSPLLSANTGILTPDIRRISNDRQLASPGTPASIGSPNVEMQRGRGKRKLLVPTVQGALLSEHEHDSEHPTEREGIRKGTHSDLRLNRRIGGIARELSAHFNGRTTTTNNEQ